MHNPLGRFGTLHGAERSMAPKFLAPWDKFQGRRTASRPWTALHRCFPPKPPAGWSTGRGCNGVNSAPGYVFLHFLMGREAGFGDLGFGGWGAGGLEPRIRRFGPRRSPGLGENRDRLGFKKEIPLGISQRAFGRLGVEDPDRETEAGLTKDGAGRGRGHPRRGLPWDWRFGARSG